MQLTDKGLRTGAPGRYGVGNLIRVLVLSHWFFNFREGLVHFLTWCQRMIVIMC